MTMLPMQNEYNKRQGTRKIEMNGNHVLSPLCYRTLHRDYYCVSGCNLTPLNVWVQTSLNNWLCQVLEVAINWLFVIHGLYESDKVQRKSEKKLGINENYMEAGQFWLVERRYDGFKGDTMGLKAIGLGWLQICEENNLSLLWIKPNSRILIYNYFSFNYRKVTIYLKSSRILNFDCNKLDSNCSNMIQIA